MQLEREEVAGDSIGRRSSGPRDFCGAIEGHQTLLWHVHVLLCKKAGWGLARLDKDEYHKVVLI